MVWLVVDKMDFRKKRILVSHSDYCTFAERKQIYVLLS